MHPPLLSALQAFERGLLPKGTQLFHGSRAQGPNTDPAARILIGTRKWLSQSAEYATSYAYYDDGRDLGSRLLWVCNLTTDVPYIRGHQASLVSASPWSNAFPFNFPNAFGAYASKIIPGGGPRALVDHEEDGRFKEVLLTEPKLALCVVDVLELPESKAGAEQLAREQFRC